MERENQSLNEQLALVRCAAPHLFAMGSSILTTLQTCCKDIPEAEFEAFREAMSNTLNEFDRLPGARIMSRFFAKGPETLNLNQFEKTRRDFNKAAKKGANDIKRGHGKLAKSMQTTADAATAAADLNPAVGAIAEIAKIPSPPSPEFAVGEILGKQTAVALRDAPVQTAQEVTRCPNCNSTDLEQGKEFCSRLRTLSADFNSLAELLEIRGHHVLCRHCNEVHYVCGSDVPAMPGRTVGLKMAISAGVLNTNGMPLNQVQPLIEHPNDQLGHDTLGRSIHDWLMMGGKPLVAAAMRTLNRQHVRMVDETPFDVLQSQGNGICEEIPEDERRQKDYMLVQASAPHEPHQIVIYDWIGARSTKAIADKIGYMHNRVLVADGYQVYDSMTAQEDAPKLQGCCAHLRRYILDAINATALHNDLFEKGDAQAFERALEKLKTGSAAHLLCGALLAMSKIYGYEKANKRQPGESEESFAQRVREHRQKYARPLMEHFDTIMAELAVSQCNQTAAGKYVVKNKASAIAQAVCYYMNRRESFKTFLSEPLAPPDNNRTERAVRAIATLRKATNFKQSQDRAQSLCIMMSLNETAKANGIQNTVEWLHDFGLALFKHMARKTLTARHAAGLEWEASLKKFDNDAMNGFDFDAWLPWNYLSTHPNA